MSDGIVIENINITVGNVYVGTGAMGSIPDGLVDLLREQIEAGADSEIMGETGYAEVPEVPVREDLTPDEQVEASASIAERVTEQMAIDIARADFLRNMVHHLDRARMLEGFHTNHGHRPNAPKKVGQKRAEEWKMAEESLGRACANCALSKICRLEGDLEKWTDTHPYKDDNSGTHRPGSTYTGKVESRTHFLRALQHDPTVHCDPGKRGDG